MEIYKQPSEMEMCHLPAISIYGYVANFFLARLVHFSYIFLSSMKIVSFMANKESGKNIVFDNQTENVHSLSQNKERGWDRKKEKTGQQKAQKA